MIRFNAMTAGDNITVAAIGKTGVIDVLDITGSTEDISDYRKYILGSFSLTEAEVNITSLDRMVRTVQAFKGE